MSYQAEMLLVDVEDHIATVSINRPDKHNALSMQMIGELDELFVSLQEDEEVGGVVITGVGQKAFAAGADISELHNLRFRSGERVSERGQAALSRIESSGKPVIAAVEGYALGGGCELALAAHLRVASAQASFGLPELGLGLMPGYGGTQRLPRLIGKGRALELILDGNPVDAARAYEIGLVNKVVGEGETVEASRKWLKHIIKKAPIAISMAIRSIHAAYPNRAQGFHDESRLFGHLCGTDDAYEGTGAFLEKRKPGFRNR